MRSVICACILGLGLLAGAGAAEPPPLPVYEARQVAEAPKVDGRLDDACWRELPRLSGFTQVIHAEGPARYPTEAMLCFDGRSLYLGILCTETEPLETLEAANTAHDSDVWADDGVEIFFDPGHTRAGCFHLCVNSRAGRYDARGMDKSWDCAWEAGAQLGTGQYAIEVAIPLARLGKVPAARDVWGFNQSRDPNPNGRKEWSCWSNTMGGFHNPGRFGLLVFGSCRAALARFVAEQDAQMATALDRVSGLLAKGCTEGERARLGGLLRNVEAIRHQARLERPLPAEQWSAFRGEWERILKAADDLELDVQFRVLLAD